MIGESGSGKSMTALAVMRLLPAGSVATGGAIAPRRQGPARATAEARDVRGPRPRHRHDLPGADDGAQPAADHRRRRWPRPCGSTARRAGRRRARSPRATLERVGLPAARFPLDALPARALRRPAPARRHRHGDRAQAEAPDRRRADHRARRHHPGADPRRSCAGWSTRTAWR